ncbi:sensor domain-containing diguanylate cyclase [Acinetobacter nectaris]|uniref:sensor domain-containing diguanylate cyclase n=1 Tax=Acinetobacter nectaris TaxID=1219382 RepID=UPI001F1F748A|nr:sensor domain-containing diguanylate cyclase [Acinetobacter nectaris]MCF9046828.1 GGDEF domain-containing protein [Acinetobacter nectaris]
MNNTSHFNLSGEKLLTLSQEIDKYNLPQEIINTCKHLLICENISFLESFHQGSYFHYQDIDHGMFSKDEAIQYIQEIPRFNQLENFSFYVKNNKEPLNYLNNCLTIKIENSHLSQEIFIFIKGSFFTSQIIHNTHFLILLNLLKLYFANTAYLQKNLIDIINLNPFYKNLAEQAPILINIIGPDLKFTLWNQECEQVFGWKHTDLQKMPNELICLFSNDLDYQKIKKFFSNKPQKHSKLYEVCPICKDGSILNTLWTSILLPNQSYINIGINITEQRKSEKILQERANIDTLTQCFNRVAIFDALDVQLKQCRDINRKFCVFLIDIDHFKLVNDTWGHMVGDKALQHFSRLLQLDQTRKIHVGRFGGEEFIVILETNSIADAFAFDEQIRRTLSTQPLYEKHEKIKLNYSSGFTMIEKGFCSRNSLLSSIDNALYRAKKQGRGRTYQSHTLY